MVREKVATGRKKRVPYLFQRSSFRLPGFAFSRFISIKFSFVELGIEAVEAFVDRGEFFGSTGAAVAGGTLSLLVGI